MRGRLASRLLRSAPTWLALAALVGCSTRGPITIPDLQASAHRSPMAGREVAELEGLVTALREQPRRNGFWIEDVRGSVAPASRGLFVSTGETPATVEPGDRVRLRGRLEELARRDGDLPVTTLVDPRVEILERGVTLPAPVLLGPLGRPIPAAVIEDDGFTEFQPDQDVLDFWESLEGMRVEIRGARVINAVDSYGNLTVVTEEVPTETPAGSLLMSPVEVHANRIELDTRPVGRPPDFRVGDRIEDPVVGVVDYGYGNFRLHLLTPLEVAPGRDLPRETTSLFRKDDELTLASYNVLNLSAVSPDERFERLAASVVDDLASPDILALQEIQDDSGREDDGVVSAAGTLSRLVEAVRARGGPSYEFRQIDPDDGDDGGQPGGNIRVAFLVDPSRVEIVERSGRDPRAEVELLPGPHLDASPGRLGVGHSCFAPDEDGRNGSRKTLALEVRFRGETLFLLNNHWTSKFGDDSFFGARQPPHRPSGEDRRCQAKLVASFVGRILKEDPRAAVVVTGDFNDYDDRPAFAELVAVGLENLVERLPREDRYSYVYRGAAGALDHVFVSPRIAQEDDVEIDYVHVNADYPAHDRASDHDPVISRIRLGG